MNIQIYPIDKVVFDNVSICFGMEKSAVEFALGVGEAIGNRYYYFNSEMAIDYQEDKVNFIEFLGGVDGKLKPTIYGVSAFDVNFTELIDVSFSSKTKCKTFYIFSPFSDFCGWCICVNNSTFWMNNSTLN